jgi:hypothetical protein
VERGHYALVLSSEARLPPYPEEAASERKAARKGRPKKKDADGS